MEMSVPEHRNLYWMQILFLSLLPVLGAVVGQVAFDLLNDWSNGSFGGFLGSAIKPFFEEKSWSVFETSLYLLRWIMAAGTLGLVSAIVLKSSRKDIIISAFLGGVLGVISLISSALIIQSFLINLIPSELIMFGVGPASFGKLLPVVFVSLGLSLLFRETRCSFIKFTSVGLVAGILGNIFFLLLFNDFYYGLAESMRNLGITSVNPARLMDAVVFTGLLSGPFVLLVVESLIQRTGNQKGAKA